METCSCEKLKKIVENYEMWTVSTYWPHKKKIPVPPEARLFWKKNKSQHDDARFFRPRIYTTLPKSICPETNRKPAQKLPNKWIPVMPGLISQRLVNESKGVTDRPF